MRSGCLRTSRLRVSAHSSLELVEATVEGTPGGSRRVTEAEWNVNPRLVNIPAGEAVTPVFRVEGGVATPGEVVTWTQPLAIEVTTDASG